jgi:hypothetical protein
MARAGWVKKKKNGLLLGRWAGLDGERGKGKMEKGFGILGKGSKQMEFKF